MIQKRSNIRRSAIIPTEVMSPYWRESLDLIASDLSPSGMYLISEAMPSVGEYIFCSFALSGEVPEYRFLSKVKRLNFHRRKTDRMRPGFGIEFLGVNEMSRDKIRAALRGLPPPIPSKHRRAALPKPGEYASFLPKDKIVIPRPSWDYPIY